LALLDRFAEIGDRERVGSIRNLQARLAAEPIERESSAIYRNLNLEPDFIDSLTSPYTPPGGIFGVGLWGSAQGFFPTVFALGPPGLAEPGSPKPLVVTYVRGVLERRLGFVPMGFLVVELPPPELEARAEPGDRIRCLNNTGTLGIPVYTSLGQLALTTAGHVAESVGAKVLTNEHVLGIVIQTDQPANHAPGEACADLAVVSVPAGHPEGPRHIIGLGTATQNAKVESLTPGGRRAGWVRGASEKWANTLQDGAWGDVFVTNEAISTRGDSGAPCLGEGGEIVGHIVAGADPAYSLVQDIQFQLTAFGVTPSLGT